METIRFSISSCDAWAGEEEGLWDINQWHHCGELELPQYLRMLDITDILINEGYLTPVAKNRVEIEDIGCGYRVVNYETREPLYDLVDLS